MHDKLARNHKKSVQSVTVNNATYSWNEVGEDFKFFGVESILFWIKPSLKSLLEPLSEELGEDLYSKLIAFEASKGTFEDYYSMVSSLGQSFEEGFHNWGAAVGSCGWGRFKIKELDWDKKRALIRIDNPWELNCFQPKQKQNNVPFLAGKISGIFSHAFETNCRAEVKVIEVTSSGAFVVLEISPSLETLEQALLNLKSSNEAASEHNLRAVNNSLRRSQKRIIDLIETTDEFIWESDMALKFSYTAGNASNVLKKDEKNILGLSWNCVLPDEESHRLANSLSVLTDEKKFVEADFEFKDQDGQVHWLRIRVKRLLDFADNHVGFVGSARDITNEIRMKNQLSEQQKSMEYSAKMATLGEMAGGVAHEINTPLAVISMLTEQLIEELPDRNFDPARSEKALNQILATTERIGKIIQGLRTIARDANQDPLNEVPLSEIFEETLMLCENRMRNNGIKLEISAVDPSLMVKCRATQISQVLINLINNSFYAVGSLKDKWIELTTEVSEDYLEIRVRDSGAGIPEEVRKKLMQPFFTTKPVGKGTGLGLSISKSIIDSHAGMLYIDEKDFHTCFVVRLPL